jgi:hypothetical protein
MIKMVRLYECDRCREHVRVIRRIDYDVSGYAYASLFMRNHKELCQSCYREFVSWIDNDVFVFSKILYDENNKSYIVIADDNKEKNRKIIKHFGGKK